MKRAMFGFLSLLILAAAPLLAAPTTLLDDVIRMSRAGVSDETIISFIEGTRDRPAATADDIIAMSEAGVSKPVIQAMIGAVPRPNGQSPTRSVEPSGSADEPPPRDTDRRDTGSAEPPDDIGCLTFDPPTAAYYEPSFPEWIWDPFWYQPRLDTKSGATARAPEGPPPPVMARQHPPAAAQGDGARPARESRPPQSHDRGHGGGRRR